MGGGHSLKNRNGFTLIELLAVIIILGILMIIAIPSVTKYIEESRRNTYIASAKEYVSGARNKVNSNELSFFDTDTTYYIHINNIPLESGGNSPFGKWLDAYVVVTYDGNDYDYYWTSVDDAGKKVILKDIDEVTTNDVMSDSEKTISRRRAVGDRKKIIIVDENGNIIEDIAALEYTNVEAGQCYIYSINNDEVTIIKYKDNCSKDVEIPSSIAGYPVTTIGSQSFRGFGITNVIFPNTIIRINGEAFYNNKIKSIKFPNSLTTIGSGAFSYNLFTELPDISMVTSLGGGVFSNNKFDDTQAFIYKRNSDGNIDYSTIVGYAGSSKDLVIPGTKEGVTLTTIASDAFRSVPLNSVVLPEGLKYIEGVAFYGCGLKSINIPSTVISIGKTSFSSNNLTNIDIPDSVTSIGSRAFNDNKLSDEEAFIYKRNSDGSIDYSTIVSYGGANRENVVIPASKNGVPLKVIKSMSFYGVGIKKISIPSSVNLIERTAFNNNNLSDDEAFIYKRNSDGSIDYSTIVSYGGANRENVVIPASKNGIQLTTVASQAFSDTSIKKVTLPEGLLYINDYAFNTCFLTEVTIPSTVLSIGAKAFPKSYSYGKFNMLTKIINKTGRSFNWKSITASNYDANFVTGTIKHQFGNIIVTDK